MARLHNITFYVDRDGFDGMRQFYAERLRLPVVFEEAGHIVCFDVGDDLAICIHEAEAGHPSGERELFLWVDDLGDHPEVALADPAGNRVRLHRHRPP